MNEKLEIIQKILSTPLLSESISSLAKTLGYKSRATLYRIMDGTASSNAVNEFLRKLDDFLLIDEDILCEINSAIENVANFNRKLKAETEDFKKLSTFDVLKAFVMHDYSVFSDDFKAKQLPGLQRLEIDNPEAFFYMLAYFYIKSLKVNFYESGKSFQEQCAQIIEPLGEKFIELYPSNNLAAVTVYLYSRPTPIFIEAPILWNCISSLGIVLQNFGTPNIATISAKSWLLIPPLSGRTYWKRDNSSDLILMREMKNNIPGSGFYEVFLVKHDSNRRSIKCIGEILFYNDVMLTYRDKWSGDYQIGKYQLDEDSFNFILASEAEFSLEPPHQWKRQPLQLSQSLRRLDKQIPDYDLSAYSLGAEGYKLSINYTVKDVRLTRESVFLEMYNGMLYEISYSEAPFLKYILPSNEVIIVEPIGKSEIYVVWSELKHYIPLKLFKRVK